MLLKNGSPFPFHLIQATREEEKMRHSVTLVKEVNSPPFYPHIVIWFDAMEEDQLIYSVLLVRRKNKKTIDQIIEKIDPGLQFTPERVQFYGDVEVNSFTLKMLAHDLSLRSLKARQRIVRVLELGLGPIRDYYGGLLEKKGENLAKLKSSFPEVDELWTETFFYSIFPKQVQATLCEQILADFFSYAMFCLNEKKGNLFQNKHGFFAYCSSDHLDLLSSLKRDFYRKGIDLHSVVSVSLKREERVHFCLFIPMI